MRLTKKGFKATDTERSLWIAMRNGIQIDRSLCRFYKVAIVNWEGAEIVK